jgi:hypothetical protein
VGGEDAGRGAGSPRRVHRRRVSQARASSARPACFGRRSRHLRSRAARAGRSPYERRGSRFEARQTEGGYGASSWASRDHFRAYRAQSGSAMGKSPHISIILHEQGRHLDHSRRSRRHLLYTGVSVTMALGTGPSDSEIVSTTRSCNRRSAGQAPFSAEG